MVGMKMGRFAFNLVSAVAILNFIAFGIVSFHYGGGGVPSIPIFNAAPRSGPYLLDNRGHFTEVSQTVFIALLWQFRIMALSPLLAFWHWYLSRRDQNSN
jgi:hypothetical protein